DSGDTPSAASTRPPTAPAPFTDGCPDAEPVPTPRAADEAAPSEPAPPAPATALPPARERLPRRWHRRKERATAPAPVQPPADERRSSREPATGVRPPAGLVPEPPYVGDGPPTYDAEPAALPAADPDHLDQLVPDTVLDGGRHGSLTLRAVSLRGDSARFRGEPRRDALLTARFGTGPDAVLLLAVTSGARTGAGTHRAAAEACGWIARAVGRSHARLAGDLRDGRRAELSSGLHRLTDHALGRLRARAAELGVEPEAYTASLRCLLLPADPARTTRVFFGVGDGGLHRLRDGAWQDLEPYAPKEQEGSALRPEADGGERITMDLGIAVPPGPWEPAVEPVREPFRFRASVARPGDVLLLSTAGFAAPLREEPEFAARLRARWGEATPPGLDGFLADVRLRVKGYADDRTAAAVWEA
ncbi:protein phosphatase 2C domain-containing protein, partial [Streptomyces albidoflavus]|uniref:protein phosphatase 2C domain-containing protein n=2 Tax=Streptomyces albidoflavus TaxID=1886 RepID=UPI00211C48B6